MATNENVTKAEEPVQQEKLFTQDEVNEIVRERLKRVKAQADEDIAAKASDLDEREKALKCWDYLKENNYPDEYLDICDHSSFESFSVAADRLDLLLNKNKSSSPVADVILKPTPHKPKKIY